VSSDDSRRGEPNPRDDFQRSVERLERAVQGFVDATGDHVTNRAAQFVDDTADRLERELRERRARNDYSREDARRERRSQRREERLERRRRRRERKAAGRGMSAGSPGYRTTRLYRDVGHQRIAGVCAGIARYFGVEAWVVRVAAISGLIFMPSVVGPAYVIAAWVLPKLPNGEPEPDRETREDHSSPAPELGVQFSPRRSLRSVQATFDQIELKLRRMESHVTSGQFELQRELKRIDV
jgi:phage shock protein C